MDDVADGGLREDTVDLGELSLSSPRGWSSKNPSVT